MSKQSHAVVATNSNTGAFKPSSELFIVWSSKYMTWNFRIRIHPNCDEVTGLLLLVKGLKTMFTWCSFVSSEVAPRLYRCYLLITPRVNKAMLLLLSSSNTGAFKPSNKLFIVWSSNYVTFQIREVAIWTNKTTVGIQFCNLFPLMVFQDFFCSLLAQTFRYREMNFQCHVLYTSAHGQRHSKRKHVRSYSLYSKHLTRFQSFVPAISERDNISTRENRANCETWILLMGSILFHDQVRCCEISLGGVGNQLRRCRSLSYFGSFNVAAVPWRELVALIGIIPAD